MDKRIIGIIENAFENIENINSNSDGDIISAINETINNLDQGNIRVAEKVNDNATFEEPLRFAEGVSHVLVNGVPVLLNGEHTNKFSGRFVKGPGFKK